MAKLRFEQISKAQVKEKRNVVISKSFETDKKTNEEKVRGYILSQQIEVSEGEKVTRLFLRNGIEIDSLKNLIALRDALDFFSHTISFLSCLLK